MNDIAVSANRGRRTLYTYFNSKEEIYFAVIQTELERLYGRMEEVARKSIPPEEKMVQLIFAHLEVMKEAVYRNGNLRAEFFRDVWKVESVLLLYVQARKPAISVFLFLRKAWKGQKRM